MRLHRLACAVLICGALGPTLAAAELPGDYFKLMEAELQPLQAETSLKSNPGGTFAAAVLYAKQRAANPSFGDQKKLELALALGDLFADASGKDTGENKQDYEWEIHFWLDTYRLLEPELGPDQIDGWIRHRGWMLRVDPASTATPAGRTRPAAGRTPTSPFAYVRQLGLRGRTSGSRPRRVPDGHSLRVS